MIHVSTPSHMARPVRLWDTLEYSRIQQDTSARPYPHGLHTIPPDTAGILKAAFARHEVLGQARSCCADGVEAIRWPREVCKDRECESRDRSNDDSAILTLQLYHRDQRREISTMAPLN